MTRGPDTADAYLMEHAGEPTRLEQKTVAAESRRQLLEAGLRSTQRALDVGAGTGAVTRVMAEIVGPGGRAVAMDRSFERLHYGTGLTFREPQAPMFCRGDLHRPPFRDAFDFVWSRFVLEYLPDPRLALEGLIQCARPGGTVVIADVDGHGLWNHPMDAVVEAGLAKLTAALEGAFDFHMGRKLYRLAIDCGLRDVQVRIEPYHVYAQSITSTGLDNWRAKLETVRPRVTDAFGGERAYDTFCAAYIALLEDPSVLSYDVLITVQGTKH